MTGGKRELTLTVPDRCDGQKVQKILREELKVSGTLIKRLKRTGGLLLNGRKIRTIDPVKTGDQIKIVLSDEGGSEHVVPVYSPIDIVYEDEDLIVVDKPAYMSVHSSRKSDLHSLANALAYYHQTKGEHHVFRAVNRLDRQTSGLMIVAKNEHANALLVQQQKERKIEKTYLAVTDGVPEPEIGTLRFPIQRADDSVLKRIVSQSGKEAVTHYKVLRFNRAFALVEIRLETGRTHQIRVHFSHIGCPLAGDWLYGIEEGAPIDRHALHAWRLGFRHPITGKTMEFEAPLPEDMIKLTEGMTE